MRIKSGIMILIILIIALCFFSCDMEWTEPYTSKISEDAVNKSVSNVVTNEYNRVIPYLRKDSSYKETEIIDGDTVVSRTLKEDKGRKYIDFCYLINESDNLDEVLAQAKPLVSAENYKIIEAKVKEGKDKLGDIDKGTSRSLPASEEAMFYKDLRRLVIRSVVLFTAGIVYACIPKVVFWGKISAACAISVSAGILASTVLSIYDYYKLDKSDDSSKAFSDWLQEVTTTPSADYALAASIIAIGNTMKQGPVVTGIVVCVFSIYQIIDLVKPMLTHYNPNA